MNRDRIEGRLKQVIGKLKECWGRLTRDDREVLAGRCDQLAGGIQQRYGLARDYAKKRINSYQRKVHAIGDSLRKK